MTKPTFRAALYRAIQKDLLKPALIPCLFSKASERGRIFSDLVAKINPTEEKKSPTGWFHASSVGELEMLVPVIESWIGYSAQSRERFGAIVTIFSESAEASLGKLAARWKGQGARILFTGYAPWEGEWNEVLSVVDPEFVMTARYEAWPELWMSLGMQDIPLVVIGAKTRGSLSWARRICAGVGQALPRISFLTVGEGEIAELREEFEEAETRAVGDPRWERVFQRGTQGNSRARELIQSLGNLPRPWGVLGSAWREDLEVFEPILAARQMKGTLWVVPHKIDEDSVRGIEFVIKRAGMRVQKTSGNTVVGDLDVLIVNEMGFLTELYSAADWAYVGGGFNEGIHNTIEPAIYGVPIACGPKNAGRFPETAILNSYGQLRMIRSTQELSGWLQSMETSIQQKSLWIESARRQLGATDRITKELLTWVSRWQPRKI